MNEGFNDGALFFFFALRPFFGFWGGIYKRTNERMNEQMNERKNERTIERTNERTHVHT